MSIERELRDLKKRLNSAESQLSKIPSRIGSSVGGSGSGSGSGWEPYVEETREQLPSDPPDGSIGFVTTGVYAGGIFTYRAGEWRGLNFWEQE